VCRVHGCGFEVMEVVDNLISYSCVIYDNAATTRPFVIMNIN